MTGESAKAVGYLITWYDTMYRGKTTVSSAPCNKDDGVSEPLITLTDHEAAMAELRAELHEKEISRLGAIDRLEGFRIEHETLLTGLEALAIRLRPNVECAPWVIDAIQKLLTNSAKGNDDGR